ncbi:hypothetical protein IBL28_12455 [Sinomicrobium sp. FJxs]|uniref:Glycoside hydrolase 123-like N-terminal domain-containing protein n=2 Tax=Sinomicrobium weinanense TaxID=2842200 RepID=A0A926JSX3_9FLAO|nr:hypothetical protein [Sinomicrobium weinanense]MBU3125527.1 hypothetical protein [Sinomicrobium weinanense]
MGHTVLICLFLISGNVLWAQKHIYPPQEELWNADSLGTRRAVVRVKKKVEEVTVAVNWRNRNVRKDQAVIVVDSSGKKVLPDVLPLKMDPESGVIQFKTGGNTGIFYVYYLPYQLGGRRNYPNAGYLKQPDHQEGKNTKFKISGAKTAEVVRLEPVDEFNSNIPMEVIATKEEVNDFKKKYKGQPYVVFPEKREFPVKMKDHLPQKWVTGTLPSTFRDKVQKGENYTFQLGIWAKDQDLADVSISYSDFKDENGNALPKELFSCFNKEGVDYTGKPFSKTVRIDKGAVQALWFGLRVPEDIPSGTYTGEIALKPSNSTEIKTKVELNISGEPVENNGVDEPWKQTRLSWINSTLAQENSVIEPYSPVEVAGRTLSILGRKVTLDKNGFPGRIESFFTEEMTSVSESTKDILTSPFRFSIKETGGRILEMKSSGVDFLKKEPGKVQWKAVNEGQGIKMAVSGTLEFDGFMNYEVKLTAQKDMELEDIALTVPLSEKSSKYMLGLGFKGRKRPGKVDWKWDVAKKNQDGWWLGDVNAGLQLSLRDENYERPLNTNFYLQKPLRLPVSWGNEGKGGIRINSSGDQVVVENYSGKRVVRKGEELYFNFTLLITPFHTIQTDQHWNNRYFHAYKPVDSVIKSGSNVINIHHANEINPYINYPFIATKEMKSYIDEAHSKNLKVKIYNTVREVSNRLYELYPLRSLNNEVFSKGNGGGSAWLQEHLQDNYIAAWYVPKYKDAAIINSGMNRWHNYYVEGMNWLVQNIGIDGIYLDDVAFDRITMKRIKRVLTQDGHPGIIDLHSANQYNERDGYINSAHLYMEHFPYINRLWFGEYFDYEKESPDFYLTEVSGIPFGLMGEMLQDGGNPWRGMLYGMTNRMPYQKKKPDQIWKAWDDFGIEGSRMIGYWVDKNPVKTSNEKVLATIYKKESKTLVSLASWAEEDSPVTLQINWGGLGLDKENVRIYAPEVKDFQPGRSFKIDGEIPVEKNKGWLLIIEEK